ncbi:twin-arginine translocase subunit TatC [Haloferax namakaokahaiae]|uniref:Twin-arginine translocase subunit TatC n=1 Tax=Haloferax namakaokahaiae TaxID=1748331 RepID=A0ABD5ZB64_9EURY
MDATSETLDGFDPRSSGLSPLGGTLRRHWIRLAFNGVLVGFLASHILQDPGVLSLTAGRHQDVAFTTTDYLVRLEVGLLVGAIAGGLHLLNLTSRHPDVSLWGERRSLVAAAVLAGGGLFVGRAVAPTLVSLLVATDRLAPAARQSMLELELFFPVAVAIGVAAAPTLLALSRSGAVTPRLSGQARGAFVLLTVSFAALFSPPDPATFALFAIPPFVGLGVAIWWVEFR